MNRSLTVALPDGRFLNARIDGKDGAPWLVMSNSVMTDLTIWDEQISALADRYCILRYDQCGHGQSSVFKGPMDFYGYAADLLALLDSCRIDRCTFIGLSMGVPTGLAAHATAPNRFERFIAVDGVSRSAPKREAFWSEQRDFARKNGMIAVAKATASRWLASVSEGSPLYRRLAEMITATPVEGFAAATHALARYDFLSVLETLNCPFLSLAGGGDGSMPDTMRAQFSHLPGARFSVIGEAGHVPNFQNPDAFNAALTAFLEASAPRNSQESA